MTQQDYLDLSPRDAELSRLYGTARRRGSLVWAANIFWVFLLILLVISFVSTVNDFKKTEIKLNNMEKAASDLLHDLNAMKAELEGVQTLQEKHTKVFAARLLEEEGVGEKLSNQEKEFLEAVRVEYVEIIESSTVNNTENISEILFLANDSFFEMFTNKANGDEEGTISLARKSVEYYMRALNLGLGAAASYYRLGVAQRFALDPSASIEALKIALQSTEADEKLHYDVLHSLGLSYLMAGDHVKAHTSMDDAIKIVRRAQQRDEGRGDKSGGSGRPVSGKEWWLNKEVETMENIGIVYLHQMRWDLALENSKKVIEADSTMVWNSLVRAIAADNVGDREMAAEFHKLWEDRSVNGDRISMKMYLPEVLKSYIYELPER